MALTVAPEDQSLVCSYHQWPGEVAASIPTLVFIGALATSVGPDFLTSTNAVSALKGLVTLQEGSVTGTRLLSLTQQAQFPTVS